ncbi:MAG: hypothetical protein RI947_150 [Candidatus Parcubacteria bacterium]|jgi:nicotinamide-nucleotide adenylyltransferase
MFTYNVGLVIGRFQPFHNGHLFVIQEALKHCAKVNIGVGSANKHDTDNPYTYGQREMMLTIMASHEQLNTRIKNIFPIHDVGDDTAWLRDVTLLTPESEVVVSNNEWVNGIFESASMPVIRPHFFDREHLEGMQIRSFIRSEDPSWHARVPSYLISYIEDIKI